MTDERFDVVVVGSGHNGLVAALYLADAGLDPLVCERNERIGGCIRSEELTREGYVHDTYSTNQNLFLDSPVMADFGEELREAGLEFSTSETPFCNVFPDGEALRVYADAERTREALADHDERDAAGFDDLGETFEAFAGTFLPLYDDPLPSAAAARDLAAGVREQGFADVLDLARVPLSSTRELGEQYFATPEARALAACWGLHLDFGPDVSGGALFPLLEWFGAVENGISVATGGASAIPEALATLVEERGGEVRTDAPVTTVRTGGGRATGVELADGTEVLATRGVVGNVTPTVLFGDLLDDPEALDEAFREKVEDYQYGPGTMMVHLALDEPLDWDADVGEFAYVHVGPYVEDLADTYADAENGVLPADPLLVVGQTTAVDPSRTPDDGEVLWVQVRALPSEIRGDAAGEIAATDWAAAAEPYADRVVEKLGEYASNVEDAVAERAVLSPADLEADNPNLVGGDSVAGSHHLRQNFLFRPFPGHSRYAMPVDDLYLCGAATWPGAGNNGTSGYLCARRMLRPPATERAVDAVADRVAPAARWALASTRERL
jgi:phytoene dehydrogenase-like protein